MANSWVYEYRAYSGDQKAAWRIADTVIETRTHPPFIAAHIQREATLLEGSAGLQPQPPADPFWYVVDGNSVYQVPGELDWDKVRSARLELVFPLPGEACWFPDAAQRSQDPASGLPGCRRATGPIGMSLPAGAFERCFQLVTPYNNGAIRQAFCSGVGFVQEQFDHVGSPFGYQITLVAYAFQ